VGVDANPFIVLIGTNTPSRWKVRWTAKGLLGAKAGATIWGMAKEDDIVSSNGASSNGASPYPPVTPEDWAEINAQRASLRKMHEELVAEGIDGTDLLPELRARAATWSQ
jgi:hypothetical protein